MLIGLLQRLRKKCVSYAHSVYNECSVHQGDIMSISEDINSTSHRFHHLYGAISLVPQRDNQYIGEIS